MKPHYTMLLNGQHLPVDQATAHQALVWLKRAGLQFVIQRRKTRYGRPAVDLVISR